MASEHNFNKITAAITANEAYENIVFDVCHMPHVTHLKEFYQIFELEEKTIDEKYDDQPKISPTIELFAEVFKKFEEYPSNLQKLRKVQVLRDRLNSNMSKSSPTLNDSIGLTTSGNAKESSLSLLNLNKCDEVPTASETLSDFVKFQRQLKQLKTELNQQGTEEEYINKLKLLNIFSQQLEKLMPTEKVGKSALSIEEEAALKDLANRMDDLNFIRSQRIFHQENSTMGSISPKLESLFNILSHCLLGVNSLNIK